MGSKQQIIDAEAAFVLQTYKRQPVVLERGEGCYVFDIEGKRYLDMVSGVAVNALGHCHPALIAALSAQMAKLMHVSNHYYTEPMIQLAEKLCRLSGLKRTFFCNSGTEANETAIKIARKWGKAARGESCFKIITFDHAFHGRTFGALSATGQKKYCAPFEPLVPGFIQLPLYDRKKLSDAMGTSVCAVMIEPVQGEGGVWFIEPDFMRELRALCNDRDILLIADEVQSGIARTGKWFGCELSGIAPDLMPLAKGLGGGFPIGACLVGEKAEATLVPGDHGNTFAGSPLAATAGLTVLKVIQEEELLSQVIRVGQVLEHGFAQLCELPLVDHQRGVGLIRALELKVPKAKEIVAKTLEAGLLLNATGDTTLRFIPPLILTEAQAGECVRILSSVLSTTT